MSPHHLKLQYVYRAEADAKFSSLQGGFGTTMDQVMSQEPLRPGSQIESTSLMACVGCTIIMKAFSCALYTEPNKKKTLPPEIFRFPIPFATFAINDKWYVSQMHLSNGITEAQLQLHVLRPETPQAKIFLLVQSCFSSTESPFYQVLSPILAL